MDNQTMRQAIDQAKQELKNIRQQIADEKSSAQPCNCDYDQLLNNIVHEQVGVNRRSAAQHRQRCLTLLRLQPAGTPQPDRRPVAIRVQQAPA